MIREQGQIHRNAPVDQKFQSIKSKYTDKKVKENASPMKISVIPPKTYEHSSHHSELPKAQDTYSSVYVPPLKNRNNNSPGSKDFRLSHVKSMLKEYQSLQKPYESDRTPHQRTLNKQALALAAKQSQILMENQQQTTMNPIPEESSQSNPSQSFKEDSKVEKKAPTIVKERSESPIKRYNYAIESKQQQKIDKPIEVHYTPKKIDKVPQFKRTPHISNYQSVQSAHLHTTPQVKQNYRNMNELQEAHQERTKARTLEKQRNHKAIEDIETLLLNIKNTMNKPLKPY